MAASKTVRAAVLESPGKIVIRALPLPRIGPDEALLRVDLVGVCGTDTKYFTGKLGLSLPTILGHEIFGTLEAVGEAAAERYGLSEGARVLVEGSIPCWSCGMCRSGEYRFCQRKREYGSKVSVTVSPGLWGGMAEYMYVAPGSILREIPDAISDAGAIAAALVANGFEWLVRCGGASIGDRIVIQGAGPQGLAATAVAGALGADQIIVTGLARDAARLALAKQLGAHHVLVADRDDVVRGVRELTDGRLADVVLDVTGSATALADSLEMVRPTGTVVLAGLAGREAASEIRPDRLVWNHIRLQGVYVKGEAAFSSAIDFMLGPGKSLPLPSIVSHVFSLDECETAITAATNPALEAFVKAAIRP